MNKYTKNIVFIFIIAFLDLICAALAVIIGFKLKFGFVGIVPLHYKNNANFYILAVFVFVVFFNIIFKLYSPSRYHIDLSHILALLPASASVFVALVLADRTLRLGMPFEMMVMICVLLLFFMLLMRIILIGGKTAITQFESFHAANESKRVIIYAAGEMGRYLCSKLKENTKDIRRPIAFIDDDKSLQGKRINGIKVIGGFRCLASAIRNYSVDEVIIALPGADGNLVKKIVSTCKQQRVEVSHFGSIENIDNPEKAKISGIKLDDLLRRDKVDLNMTAVKRFIEGKNILITGGAGSIGSEICRQLLTYGAKSLVLFDIDENGLFDIGNELSSSYDASRFALRIGSIRDKTRLKEIFTEFKIDVVFHAAAHKHVPMMEDNPAEAIKNNVFGTINVAQAASRYNCENFILISTDKAVNPGNIMGASKRIAEQAIQMLNAVCNTNFAAVRFGNVLGSSGSVVPFFISQIENGGPVTVTHPDMRRYFMTIPEAVQLVLEAGSIAKGGEIFVLDMGKPVRIYDLACDLIMLYGLKPNIDIKIEFCGLRPGEKLFEEIKLVEEDVSKTDNNKIYVLKPAEIDFHAFATTIKDLEKSCYTDSYDALFENVKKLVPTFNHRQQ